MVFFKAARSSANWRPGWSRNGSAPVVSVVSGGIACVAATVWIAATTPALRRYRKEPRLPIRDPDP